MMVYRKKSEEPSRDIDSASMHVLQLSCLDVARASDHHRQTEHRERAADAGTAASFPSTSAFSDRRDGNETRLC